MFPAARPCFNALPKETNYKTAEKLLMSGELKYSMFFLFYKQTFIFSVCCAQT